MLDPGPRQKRTGHWNGPAAAARVRTTCERQMRDNKRCEMEGGPGKNGALPSKGRKEKDGSVDIKPLKTRRSPVRRAEGVHSKGTKNSKESRTKRRGMRLMVKKAQESTRKS